MEVREETLRLAREILRRFTHSKNPKASKMPAGTAHRRE